MPNNSNKSDRDKSCFPDYDLHATMRAAILYGVRDVRVEKKSIPNPSTRDVFLKIEAVGICGSDIHYYKQGRIGDQVVNAPTIMGHEFSATVMCLGKDVENLHIGERVAVDPAISCGKCEQCLSGNPNLCPNVCFCGTPPINGVFAEYAVMPAANCFLLPDEMSFAEGTLLEPLGVAIHAINLSHLKPGNTVAVLGAGPIGLLIASVAKASGASVVYMTEPLEYRRNFAKKYIADHVIDPVGHDAAENILELTEGRGVDLVFEAAGAPETPAQAAKMVRTGGKIILAGIPDNDEILFNASMARRKGLTIKLVRRMKHSYPSAIQMVKTGMVDLKPLITHHFPLTRVGEAMAMLSNYQDGVIKVVIE